MRVVELEPGLAEKQRGLGTLDSENNDRESKVKEVIRSQTREMQELKEELEQTESLFKTERSRTWKLRGRSLKSFGRRCKIGRCLIDVSVQLEEIKSPLFVSSVKKGEVLLRNRKTQIKDRLNLEMKNKHALGELQNMRGEWQRMDQALQQKAAEVESEHRDKDMEVKALPRSHQLKVHKIKEKHRRAKISYKAEIESLKKQSQEIWDRDALEDQNCQLEQQTSGLQGSLRNMTNLCQQKEQMLQHSTASKGRWDLVALQ
ncbi:hypothetical protein AAFF_G00089930 [Aldrovandia affinis]|uniref:Uncharacterized protein n=1 Tax=Aldrovandia affinis TaxID=143900 RepID=A0AAD7WC75_9TELE|nr:hypothetical protein AAFF_G00089930 [Aldrovandia affinis]